ncbi:hypothetical protein [Paenarthrobacter aurescens]|jgi:hypothetical protein|uniref:hypothetical protein n=1 Tax=Paenarthrobacter aurescens TaxID=43663 RepID=UPI0005C1F020|nr:hypothetical protein [Paenarthrobacter aurescens]
MCTHAYEKVCLHVPRLVRAALFRSDRDCFLEFEYSGELPCNGTFIMGVEMVHGDRGDVRHCCIEFTNGAPAGTLTYDFRAHRQANHGPASRVMGANIVRGRFPSWPFQDWTPGEAIFAFALQNGATTACGVPVFEGPSMAEEELDRFYPEAC